MAKFLPYTPKKFGKLPGNGHICQKKLRAFSVPLSRCDPLNLKVVRTSDLEFHVCFYPVYFDYLVRHFQVCNAKAGSKPNGAQRFRGVKRFRNWGTLSKKLSLFVSQ